MKANVQINDKKNGWQMIPIVLGVGFVPMLVRLCVSNTGLSSYEWYPDVAETVTDTFLICKMLVLIGLGLLILGILIWNYIKNRKLTFANPFYALAFYGMFVIMSALFSPYKTWVGKGVYGVYEPVWVLLTYMLICYYTFSVVSSERQVYTILGWSVTGAIIISCIGLFQLMGKDFFRTELGMKLTIGNKMIDQIESVDYFFEGNVVSTLYNPNYCSFYFGMLIPVSFAMLVAVKNKLGKIVSGMVLVLACICMYGAHVATSWFALLLTVVILVLIVASRKRRLFVVSLVGLCCVIVVGLGVGAMTGLGTRLTNLILGTYDWGEEGYPVYHVQTEDTYALVNAYGEDIILSYDYDDLTKAISVSCVDSDGKEISKETNEYDENTMFFTDERFPNVSVTIGQQFEMPAVNLKVGTTQWIFTKDIDGTYYYLNPAVKFVKVKEVKNAGLFHEDALSGRGRLWNRILPLLPKHFFVGSGANTFVFEYPQHDYLYRAQTGENNTLDVKAHNWYLQQMVETGVVGTVLLLIFLGLYVVKSVRIYRRADLHRSITIMGVGFFAAILVYLIAALANDSNVCTAPVFWCLLGLGMAVNEIIVKQEGLVLGKLMTDADGLENEVTDSKSNVKIVMQRTSDENRNVSPKQNVDASGENSVRKNSGKKQSRKQRKKVSKK